MKRKPLDYLTQNQAMMLEEKPK